MRITYYICFFPLPRVPCIRNCNYCGFDTLPGTEGKPAHTYGAWNYTLHCYSCILRWLAMRASQFSTKWTKCPQALRPASRAVASSAGNTLMLGDSSPSNDNPETTAAQPRAAECRRNTFWARQHAATDILVCSRLLPSSGVNKGGLSQSNPAECSWRVHSATPEMACWKERPAFCKQQGRSYAIMLNTVWDRVKPCLGEASPT